MPRTNRPAARQGAIVVPVRPRSQEAKIAAQAKPQVPSVTFWTPIYAVSKGMMGVATHEWLCDAHVETRRATGWEVKEIGLRPGSLAPQKCSDCTRA